MNSLSLTSIIEEFGVGARFRHDESDDWNRIHDSLSFQGIMVSDLYLDYQKSYFQDFCNNDLSIVLYKKDGAPCGIIPMQTRVTENKKIITTGGLPIEPIQFIDTTSYNDKKRISKSFLKGLLHYARLNANTRFECHSYNEFNNLATNPWYSSCAELANSRDIVHQVHLDLTQKLQTIWTAIRKSYKPLINKSDKIWSSEILGSCKIRLDDWEEFKALHYNAAGNRQTRSDESWKIQFQQILDGNAFLIALRDNNRTLVGGGFFQHTRDEGMYAVAAYDRKQFDKPIGHLVQWLAIKELKRLGVASYIIGKRPYLSDTPTPSEKEINIGVFKNGFSNNIRLQHVFKFE